MFTDKLSKTEKNSLVQLLTFVARSDGKLAEQEWQFLNRFCQDNGLVYDINEEFDLDHTCARINSNPAKVITMQQVVKMALIDGEYDDHERQTAAEIALKLQMDIEQFKEIERWVLDGYEWHKKGEAMVHI